MLIQLSCHFVNHLFAIFNSTLRLQHFPGIWKKAEVITKSLKTEDLSVSSVTWRIDYLIYLPAIWFQKLSLVLCWVDSAVIETGWVYHLWIGTKWVTVAVFLDISKAYDSTWHTGLLLKLIQLNNPGALIKVIYSYLAHRLFSVKMGGKHLE